MTTERPFPKTIATAALAVVAALALAASVPGLLLAQGPGDHPAGPPGAAPEHDGSGRPLARLARYLELTEEQRQQARAIFTAAHDQAAPIREEIRDLRGQLRELLEGDAPDAAAVGQLVLDIHADRQELRAIHETAMSEFRGILTELQLIRLDALRDARRIFGHGHRGHRPGGPGPGGDDDPGFDPLGIGGGGGGAGP